MGACSPFRPLTSIGLILLVVSLVFLLVAVIRPYFLTLDIGHLGSFETCDSSDNCRNIAADCSIENANGDLPGCTTYNTFRGLLILAIIVSGVQTILATFVLFTLRTTLRVWKIILLILGVVSLASLGISFFSLVGWRNNNPIGDQKFDFGSSFALEVVGTVLLLIGTIFFFFGARREGLTDAPPKTAPGYAAFNDNTGLVAAAQQQPGYASYA